MAFFRAFTTTSRRNIWAQGDLTWAYAHFKAAILADPGYSPSYSNLAQLYERRGLLQNAEQLLLHAVALNEDADIALRSLHQLLVSKVANRKASKYTEILAGKTGQGSLTTGSASDSITSREGIIKKPLVLSEHAQALTSGFRKCTAI